MAHIWQFVCVYWCRMSQKEETQKFVIWAKFQKRRTLGNFSGKTQKQFNGHII